MGNTAYLFLENGEVFKGEGFASDKDVIGEVVFTTGTTGYMETVSDPCYYGQIVVNTYPLIGNYGIIKEDCVNSGVYLNGLIVKEICDFPCNFRSSGKFEDYLKDENVTGLKGIDTRALTVILRDNGSMKGIITKNDSLTEEQKNAIKNYSIKDAIKAVSVKEPENIKAQNPEHNVVILDYGKKSFIQNLLLKRNCDVTVLPYNTSAEEILKYKPDGIILSTGPGNPEDYKEQTEVIRKLFESKIPLWGIGLGHQLLALSQGGKTFKLKYGHRGSKSVKYSENGRVYITYQNHGYSVEYQSIKDKADLLFSNVNDNSCEGLLYKGTKTFSVQFDPTGEVDTEFLFDKFIENLKN